MGLWRRFNDILNNRVDEIHEAIITAFISDPYLSEIKNYFLQLIVPELKYSHIDRILTSMERRFNEMESDGSDSYLLTNLNPIKTACILLMILHMIEKRYSVTKLRTSNLVDQLIKKAKAVLEQLFFPTQIKFHLR